MIPLWRLSSLFRDRWVVLDARLFVIDHGASLSDLRARHGARRCTFYFVAG